MLRYIGAPNFPEKSHMKSSAPSPNTEESHRVGTKRMLLHTKNMPTIVGAKGCRSPENHAVAQTCCLYRRSMRLSKHSAAKRLTCDNRAVKAALPHKNIPHARSTYFFPERVGVLPNGPTRFRPTTWESILTKLQHWRSAPTSPFI